ncbi:hypothetical protein DWA10_20580, partial [Acinetobacter baumannii]|uniref:hypothetical protein n=1 Tax=Acinetobacter baumannii TaxID=470 RepID=UPI00105A73FF
MAYRRGNAVTKSEWRNKIDTLEATAWPREIIKEHKPDRANIDSGNIGQAIITNLRAQDPTLDEIIRSVAFGS